MFYAVFVVSYYVIYFRYPVNCVKSTVCLFRRHLKTLGTCEALRFDSNSNRPFRFDVGHFVWDKTETETLRVWDETETETFQLPRHWPRRVVKKIKHHKINWTSKHHRGGGAQHSTLPSSATFSSVNSVSRIHRHTDEQHKNILPPTGLH